MLSLPDLAGGLNSRDGISEVLDNQLTECANIWYKDGILKTRPGIVADENRISTIGFHPKQKAEIKNFSNIRYNIDNEQYFLQALYVVWDDVIGDSGSYLKFYWVNDTQTLEIEDTILLEPRMTFFVCLQKDVLYCFTSGKQIYKYDIKNADKGWQDTTNDVYIPKVLIQCEAMSNKKNVTKEQILGSGVMIEGFNILSDYYQMSYNSYNPMIVTAENSAHEMRYHIVESVAQSKYAGKTITAKYIKDGKEYTHEIELIDKNKDKDSDNTWNEPELNKGDKLRMKVWKNNVTFWGEDGKLKMIKDGDEDDIVITAPYISSDKEKIFNMSRGEWYGGGNSGLKGGTRLFLCGNATEPSLVVWSDLNNPLYFPENSYFYVGESSSPVTGFGKQSDMLIIFKENETWGTTYQQNTNITAENLTNQSVVDITTSVYFPLTQINPNIGCAYPDSIQLCRNRLVWLGNDNEVYTLVNESAYNERSIFCVSEMVDRKLKEFKGINPTSCDWNGYYCLCFGSEVFLMDYNCYGFTHISSYSKSEDANIRIPWYYWEFPIGLSGLISTLNGSMIHSYYVDKTTTGYCAVISNTLTESNIPIDFIVQDEIYQEHNWIISEEPILSTATTKLFDFGLQTTRKNIEQVNLQLGNNGGKEIKVCFITENGSEETEILLDGDDTFNRSAPYIESKAVFPCIKQVLRFGLKIETTGVLAIDSAIIKFRTTGGAR